VRPFDVEKMKNFFPPKKLEPKIFFGKFTIFSTLLLFYLFLKPIFERLRFSMVLWKKKLGIREQNKNLFRLLFLVSSFSVWYLKVTTVEFTMWDKYGNIPTKFQSKCDT